MGRALWQAAGMEFEIKPLTPETWGDFAALVERHKGVWGGCWCMGFHARTPNWGVSAEGNRSDKQALVMVGRAQAALVFDGEACLGWCQYGPTAELPRIKHRKAYEAGQAGAPDWRITCFFVDKAARGRGVARAALAGAVALIAKAGGGTVEAYPEAVTGRKVAASFLFGATAEMFAAQGFVQQRPLGKAHWVMQRQIAREG